MRKILFFAVWFCLPSFAFSAPYYGMSLYYLLTAKEPPDLHGYQFMLSYDPQRFQWRQFNVYFDGGFSHYWDNDTRCYSGVTIYSVAPIIRYTFRQRGPIHPYLELSIGVSYLNHTHIETRNLGEHFSFQDRFGIGGYVGTNKQFSIGLQAVHYSNARFCAHNSGLTVPLELALGYRFN